jgi:hypothetical protein
VVDEVDDQLADPVRRLAHRDVPDPSSVVTKVSGGR